MDQRKLNFINLLLIHGLNIKNGQILYVIAPLECSDFVHELVKQAYKLQASYVDVEYFDPLLKQIRYQNSSLEGLNFFPNYISKKYINMYNENVSILKLNGGLNPQINFPRNNQKLAERTERNALNEYNNLKKANKLSTSCSTVIPTKYWAKQIFKDLDDNEALEKMWQHLYKITSCDQKDPLDIWEKHISTIEKRRDWLNNQQFEYLYIYDNFTNLHVKLPQDHKWIGGCEYTSKNVRCLPNFPNEEIFVAPTKYGVNGKVYSSKPLSYNNQIIDDFYLEFKDGKVVNYDAKKGKDILKSIINFDGGSDFCGEIALLAYKTIVSRTNTTYLTTLLDENAACHMALGCAYPINLQKEIACNESSYKKHNLNYSKLHCDFMFGRQNTTIIAYKNNTTYKLIENGNWLI